MTDTVKAKNAVYLDLDAVVPDNDVVVRLGGVDHPLVPITLEDFVRNTKTVQDLDVSTDPETEMELVKTMLFRAFPSMTPEIVNKLTLIQLNRLMDFSTEHNGTKQVDKEVSKEATPDPKPAGQ